MCGYYCSHHLVNLSFEADILPAQLCLPVSQAGPVLDQERKKKNPESF